MKERKIEDLIIKFIAKTINQEELGELSAWVEKKENAETFRQYIEINYALDYNLLNFDDDKAIRDFIAKIDDIDSTGKIKNGFFRFRYRVAAAITLFITLGFLVYFNYKETSVPAQVTTIKSKVLPGTDKAVLTLENGDYVTLEKGKNFASANRSSDGEKLMYDKTDQVYSNLQFNYLTIPKGGQFFVQLSDGTKVWLNADSKLKYPVNFPMGQTREVELLYGEAYFDVSPSTEHNGSSFRVKNQLQTIEVLGTEFNVKSYQDDSSYYTTLVEGNVAIGNDIVSKVLRPGEQSVIGRKSEEIHVREVDVDYEVSWKNGLFMFNQESLESMLKTLSRWYDVAIVFENEEKRIERFSGVLKRTDNIDHLLMKLEKTGEVEFEINGKEIMVK